MAYDANDVALDTTSFPHLNKYMNCDDTPNVLGKDVLLHEYTRSLDRTTSACVKSVTRRWQKDAPAMYDSLDLPARDEDCLLLEMCATLDLHEHAKFPSGSELTGFVEVAITQPALQNHRWKCVTRLTRPNELHSEDGKPELYTNESGIHRRGCSDSRSDCECHLRPRADIHVPFPAVEWASILSMAVQYPDTEHQRKKEKRSASKGGVPDRAGSKRKRSDSEGDANAWSRREPTGSDLICKVAMYQELWSCAPDSSRWVRQGIIFWRFSTTNQWYKYNPVFRPAGTTWRWLTVNDPMSRYHQQKALVYPSSGGGVVGRDAVMSPTPSVGQHLTAAMNETFNQWDGGVQLAAMPSGQSNMALFDGFSSGLATPPPSASLHGSYSASGSFDANAGVGNFMPSSCGAEQTGGLTQSHQPYFDSSQAVSSFSDVKPMSAQVPYMGGSTSLDLSTQLGGVDYSNANHNQHHENHGGAGLQGWDMGALGSWTGGAGAPATTPTGEYAQPGMWNPVQWSQNTGRNGEGSPRPMKRRRADGMDGGVPVSTGW